ncbi:MAG: hypothetical protein AABY40_00915, partial [Nanoarchaeota archaeon]
CLLFILGGYFFGNITFVKEHFNLVVISIVIISFAPIVKTIVHGLWKKRKKQEGEPINNIDINNNNNDDNDNTDNVNKTNVDDDGKKDNNLLKQ